MRAVLIDDEQHNLENLEALLKSYCPMVQIMAKATDADEGKMAILKYQPDLVFLDIQMPRKSGFDLLFELQPCDFEVIFITAYDQYAIQAFKFAAVDYLLKPVNINELQAAAKRASVKCSHKKHNLQLENLLQLMHRQKEDHRIALPTLKETRYVRTEEIIRCESLNNYTNFFLVKDEKIIVSRPIYEYEELLKNYGFIRCHQSHLVNKKYVRSWVKEDGGFLLLENNDQVPVSRNKKEMIARELGNNIS
jgi:two-component system LytT family response regulator